MNTFVRHHFKSTHNSSPENANDGSFVKSDYGALFCFPAKEYMLQENAEREGGIGWGVPGDGATFLGKFSARQFAVGFKPIDEDAVDLETGERLFYDMVPDSEGVVRKRYNHYQNIDYVAIAAISIKGETKKILLKEMFGLFFCLLED